MNLMNEITLEIALVVSHFTSLGILKKDTMDLGGASSMLSVVKFLR